MIGAQAPTWLALLPPQIEGPKGSFVWSDKQIFDWVNGPIPPFYWIISWLVQWLVRIDFIWMRLNFPYYMQYYEYETN